jgi:hypothetical protein
VTGWENSGARPSALETSRPNIARVSDYWLGGKDNFETPVPATDSHGRAAGGSTEVSRYDAAALVVRVRLGDRLPSAPVMRLSAASA